MLRSGTIANAVARAWAGSACGVQGACTSGAAAATAVSGTCSNASAQLGRRWHSTEADESRSSVAFSSPRLPATASCSISCANNGSGSAVMASRCSLRQLRWPVSAQSLAFSTSASAAEPATTAASQPQQQQPSRVEVLTPAEADIPASSRAILADEQEAISARAAGIKTRLREKRRPNPAGSSSSEAGDAATSAAAALESGSHGGMDDPEVRLVFEKLVGGLTKQGKKRVARRIVLEAMQIMQQRLKKGNLDEIK